MRAEISRYSVPGSGRSECRGPVVEVCLAGRLARREHHKSVGK